MDSSILSKTWMAKETALSLDTALRYPRMENTKAAQYLIKNKLWIGSNSSFVSNSSEIGNFRSNQWIGSNSSEIGNLLFTSNYRINEAIFALKERTGSSQYAIAKHIEDNQKHLPANFKKAFAGSVEETCSSRKTYQAEERRTDVAEVAGYGIEKKVTSSIKLGSVEKKVTEKKA
ncbi:hypothetical protein L2E82_22676 [Cichorium intybus]|uniref:Uncharacterized protein n=1 Tax=Cichorium intybus TaxID=13427 RepID=A0ACB9DZE8_CICIN|nr:hypothetical protein L2E82_22676 [Cichorium intybus]